MSSSQRDHLVGRASKGARDWGNEEVNSAESGYAWADILNLCWIAFLFSLFRVLPLLCNISHLLSVVITEDILNCPPYLGLQSPSFLLTWTLHMQWLAPFLISCVLCRFFVAEICLDSQSWCSWHSCMISLTLVDPRLLMRVKLQRNRAIYPGNPCTKSSIAPWCERKSTHIC